MDFRCSGRDQLFGGVVYLIICLDPSQTHARLWERALGILWSWAWTFPPRRDPGSGRTALASQILGPGRRAALTSYCLGPGPLPRHALACERAALASYGLGPGPPPDATLNLGAWPWHLMVWGRDLSPDMPLHVSARP